MEQESSNSPPNEKPAPSQTSLAKLRKEKNPQHPHFAISYLPSCCASRYVIIQDFVSCELLRLIVQAVDAVTDLPVSDAFCSASSCRALRGSFPRTLSNSLTNCCF